MSILSGLKLIGLPLLDAVTDHFKHRRRIKEAEVESEIKIIEKKVDHLMDWENQAQFNASKSWKDEWWTFLFSLPLIALFIPPLADYAAQGFVALNDKAPDWYVFLVVMMVLVSFGIRPTQMWWDMLKSRK